MNNTKDLYYIQKYLDGDTSAFGVLYDTHFNLVWNAVIGVLKKSNDVEDVVHDVFIKVSQQLHMFKKQSGFHHWLHRVAHNFATNYVITWERRKKNHEKSTEHEVYRVKTTMSLFYGHPMVYVLYRELVASLRKFLLEWLSPGERDVMLLLPYGLDKYEIATRLERTPGTVVTQRYMALQKLSDYLVTLGYEKRYLYYIRFIV
jgi:RNA polymerase sigma-70 factor (ECF subfamily)